MVKIALILERYFPYGGLQRDFMRIAKAFLDEGMHIEVFTTQWEGELLACPIHIISTKSFTHHSRMLEFSKKIKPSLEQFDLTFGFNKLPDLDYYFASDPCFAAKNLSWIKRCLPRYKSYLFLEKTIFDKQAKTEVLILTLTQQILYQNLYGTPSQRFHLIPPGIPYLNLHQEGYQEKRETLRKLHKIKGGEKIFLMVASHFYTKGLDRTLEALQYYKNKKIQLWIIGGDNQAQYLKQANQLGILEYVKFLGAKPALEYMIAADALLHPARTEAAGMVLVEAMTTGLPVITIEDCGYAFHIKQAKAGKVLASYQLEEFQKAIAYTFDESWRKQCSENALQYAQTTDLYHMTDKVLEIMRQRIKGDGQIHDGKSILTQ